ncbi:PIR Superfamily Protein [Plasmodium ovale curtisi]|uniref:PIR Superfamily Protein n=1 Tax=Plasmodium ovale curtisi TaxID=864141 RepID=A0A1A8WGU6_PLAOA|nr:PIR Superfamily Protein [Plasmodium ovale curtisi]
MGKIKDDELPSNRYKRDLLKNIKIKELEDTCKSDNTKYNCISQAIEFCTSLYSNYHTIRKRFCELQNDPKCCIDVNYYIDYVNEIIKSSKFNDPTKEEYIQKIEQIWRDYFGKTHAYKCTREENTHSKYERCIINQLSDFFNDKDYLEKASSQNSNIYIEYDQYIQEKLSNILKCEKLNSENISITINDQPIAQRVKCNNLPLKSQLLKNNIINNVQNIKVTFSAEAIRTPARDDHSHTPVEESRITHGTGFAETGSPLVIEPLDETNSSFTRIIVTVISMILGIFFLFLMLYKFSPFGSLVNNRIKKGGEIQQTINYEKIQLLEEPEDSQYYIKYDSSSH